MHQLYQSRKWPATKRGQAWTGLVFPPGVQRPQVFGKLQRELAEKGVLLQRTVILLHGVNPRRQEDGVISLGDTFWMSIHHNSIRAPCQLSTVTMAGPGGAFFHVRQGIRSAAAVLAASSRRPGGRGGLGGGRAGGDDRLVDRPRRSAGAADRGGSGRAADRSVPGRCQSGRLAELANLPGVGSTLARRIVDCRRVGGPFLDHKDLRRRVRGIGPRTLETMRPYLLPMPPGRAVAGK